MTSNVENFLELRLRFRRPRCESETSSRANTRNTASPPPSVVINEAPILPVVNIPPEPIPPDNEEIRPRKKRRKNRKRGTEYRKYLGKGRGNPLRTINTTEKFVQKEATKQTKRFQKLLKDPPPTIMIDMGRLEDKLQTKWMTLKHLRVRTGSTVAAVHDRRREVLEQVMDALSELQAMMFKFLAENQ